MSKPRVAKLSARVNLDRGIECVDINAGINVATTATLQMGQKTGGSIVVRPITADVLAEIRAQQQKRLGGIATPDVTLFVDDAIYGSITMEGFLASPMLEISDGNIGYQANVLDKVSIIDGLDLSIYTLALASLRKAEVPDTIPRPTGDVCELLLGITNALVERADTAIEKETDPVKKQIIEMQHALNTSNNGPLHVWRNLLQGSIGKVKHESWVAMLDSHENAGKHISYKVADMLCAKSSGFWSIFNGLMSGFQMFYRPSFDPGSYGELVINKEKVDGSGGDLYIPAVNVNARDGSARILQVGGVIMEAAGPDCLRKKEVPGSISPSCAGFHPDPILPGFIHREIPPIWLVDANGVQIRGSAVDEKKSEPPKWWEGPNLNLDAYKTRKDKSTQHAEKIEDARSEVMNEFCAIVFKEIQLADSVISARIPLQLGIGVGKRYDVNIAGAGIVKGFVSSASHHIDLRLGKEMESYTQVTISHVEY